MAAIVLVASLSSIHRVSVSRSIEPFEVVLELEIQESPTMGHLVRQDGVFAPATSHNRLSATTAPFFFAAQLRARHFVNLLGHDRVREVGRTLLAAWTRRGLGSCAGIVFRDSVAAFSAAVRTGLVGHNGDTTPAPPGMPRALRPTSPSTSSRPVAHGSS